jgi:NAD(P)-dependent dehydrogenase (short-subunit alcohol dehydrogenase family)
MQMFILNRKLRSTDVSVSGVHPGLVDTEATRGFNDFLFWNMYFKVYKWLGKRRFILKFIDLLLFLGL